MHFKDRIDGIFQLRCRENTFIEKKKPFYSFNRKKNRTIYFSFCTRVVLFLLQAKQEGKTAEISTLVIFVFSNFEPFGGV